MTLVCAAFKGNAPVLLGDTLVTSTSADGGISIPTNENAGAITRTAGAQIVAQVFKLCIIRPNFALAWTGDYASAKRVISRLDAILEERTTFEHVHKLLATFDEDEMDLALLGSVVCEQASIFRWDGRGKQATAHDLMFVDGNGAREFRRRLEITELHAARGELGISNQLIWALRQIGQMTFDEITIGRNLSDLFGGGFDIVFFDGARFTRVHRVIHLQIWTDLSPTYKDGRKMIEFESAWGNKVFWQEYGASAHFRRYEILSRDGELLNADFQAEEKSAVTIQNWTQYDRTITEANVDCVVVGQEVAGDKRVIIGTHVFASPSPLITVNLDGGRLILKTISEFWERLAEHTVKAINHPLVQARLSPDLRLQEGENMWLARELSHIRPLPK